MGKHPYCDASTCMAPDSAGAFSRRRLLGVTAGVVGPLLLPVMRNPIFAGLAEEIAHHGGGLLWATL